MNKDDNILDTQFDQLLNQLEVEKAPTSLKRRLSRAGVQVLDSPGHGDG